MAKRNGPNPEAEAALVINTEKASLPQFAALIPPNWSLAGLPVFAAFATLLMHAHDSKLPIQKRSDVAATPNTGAKRRD